MCTCPRPRADACALAERCERCKVHDQRTDVVCRAMEEGEVAQRRRALRIVRGACEHCRGRLVIAKCVPYAIAADDYKRALAGGEALRVEVRVGLDITAQVEIPEGASEREVVADAAAITQRHEAAEVDDASVLVIIKRLEVARDADSLVPPSLKLLLRVRVTARPSFVVEAVLRLRSAGDMCGLCRRSGNQPRRRFLCAIILARSRLGTCRAPAEHCARIANV
mmetsp:Transcript_49709/g.129573  ORF Transcript_49709/g.129573 Transcript_49709/m.129573 type:complete len:224 (-) Transcript_49709:222-893(-)